MAQLARFSTELALVFFHTAMIIKFVKADAGNVCKKIKLVNFRAQTRDWVVCLSQVASDGMGLKRT
jgi:hypothetical protein